MKNKINFTKMHGLGNDFIIILNNDLPNHIDIIKFAQDVSNRKSGVGCDQLIIFQEIDQNASINTPAFQMNIYNQDGSKALACGNASRCLSRLIFDTMGYKDITLNVSGRLVSCNYIDSNQIKINLGQISFDKKWMPATSELWNIAERYFIEPKEVICVDVANPHLVIFSKLSDNDRNIIGQELQKSHLFNNDVNNGINVNFATIKDKKILLSTWERGVGLTDACGSGAVATFAAANKLGFSNNQAIILLRLGNLYMQKIDNNFFMSGPAKYSFDGQYII